MQPATVPTPALEGGLRAASSPRSAGLFDRARHVMPSGYTRDLVARTPHPNYAASAQGCWITDVDGHRWIDWVNNFASLIHGHGRREIVDVIAAQAGRLMSTVMPTEWEVRLAEILCERLPSVERVRFTNSGTEANAVAAKVARAYTGRPKLAKMEGGYHGQFDLLEASFMPEPADWGDAARPRAVAHNIGTPQSLLDELVVLPLNDIEATRALLREHASSLAAVILDPWRLQVNLVEPRQDYLEMLREETARHGIVLIFDEVVSFRASYRGTQGLCGVVPDLTTLGKIIGGGLPVGAIGGRADVMGVLEMEQGPRKVKHSGTFTANPLTMAAGVISMELLTPHALATLDRRCERLREGLRRIHRDLRLPGLIEGQASLTALVLSDVPLVDYRSLAAARRGGMADLVLRLENALVDEGVFMLRGSLAGSTAMTDDDVDLTLEAARRALARVFDRG